MDSIPRAMCRVLSGTCRMSCACGRSAGRIGGTSTSRCARNRGPRHGTEKNFVQGFVDAPSETERTLLWLPSWDGLVPSTGQLCVERFRCLEHRFHSEHHDDDRGQLPATSCNRVARTRCNPRLSSPSAHVEASPGRMSAIHDFSDPLQARI